MKKIYFPGIDGLRALAVLAVVLYHANLGWASGGFIGVQVFFVISGFLITNLLATEFFTDAYINLLQFWKRRARRLLPASYFLIFAVLTYAVFFLPSEVATLRKDALAALFYVTNWYYVFDQRSYFETFGRPSLLGHLWSLAVEEQFYLLWPPLLYLLLKVAGRRVAMILALLAAAASLVWLGHLYNPDTDPSRVYFRTDAQLGGLLIGGAFVLWWQRDGLPCVSRAAAIFWDVAALLGLGIIGWACYAMDSGTAFFYRGGLGCLALLVLPILATCSYRDAHGQPGYIARLLTLRPLVYIGTRSYSIYLWHYPLFLLTRPYTDVAMGGYPLLFLRLAGALALAEISYRFIESPVRNGTLMEWWQRHRFAAEQIGSPARHWPFAMPAGAAICLLWLGYAAFTAQPSENVIAREGQEEERQAKAQPGPVPSPARLQRVAAPVAAKPRDTNSLSPRQVGQLLPQHFKRWPRKGQILLHGRVREFTGLSRDLLLDAELFVLPNKRGGRIQPTKVKKVILSSRIDTRDMIAGDAVFVLGSDGASGTPLRATWLANPDRAQRQKHLEETNVLVQTPPAPGMVATLPQEVVPYIPTNEVSSGRVPILAIGDSVMLGARRILRKRLPGAIIDTVGSRQIKACIQILDGYRRRGKLPPIVIVHIGTNGYVREEDFDKMMSVLSGVPYVIVFTLRDPWMERDNAVITAGAARYSNVVLADWSSLSNPHTDWFIPDGIHLTPTGRQAYADFLTSQVVQCESQLLQSSGNPGMGMEG